MSQRRPTLIAAALLAFLTVAVGTSSGAIAKGVQASSVQATSADCPVGQFRSEFFNNRTMSGTPALTRCDASLNWSLASGAPGAGVTADNFSGRFVGQFDLAVSGTYTFTVTADDGVRLYVDGVRLIDRWVAQPPTTYTGKAQLQAGRHEVRIEYFEATGGATLRYGFTPPASACAVGQFRSEFFNNRTMSGTPVLSRCDATVNWLWGSGSPGSGVTADSFSARLVGQVDLTVSGTYTFSVTADDGVRLYVDGVRLIDAWVAQAPTSYTGQAELQAGQHEVRIEYFEATGEATLRHSVSAPTPPPPPPAAPANTALPILSGTAQVGQTLTVSQGSWSGSPTSFAYQWRRCDSAGASCANISGATSSSYLLASADQGATVRATVNATNSAGSASASSAPSGVVAALPAAAPVCTVGHFRSEFFNNRTMSGTAALSRCDAVADWGWGAGSPGAGVSADNFSARLVGQFDLSASGSYTFRVTADDGVRLFVDGLRLIDAWVAQAPTTYSGEAVLQAGRHEVRIEYFEATGDATLRHSVSAPAPLPPLPPPPAAPANTAPPVFSGTAQVGQTLTVSQGTWSGSPTSFAYQWRRCDTAGASCTNISGATSSSYLLATADQGSTMRATVTATNTIGSATATSAQSTVVAAPPPPPPAGQLNLPRVPWEGGAGYYSRFPKAHASGWSDPGFFPISVFLGKPSHASILRSVGINTYQGAEHDGSSIASMTSAGMFVLAQGEWSAAEVGNDPRAVGWLVGDECEMGYSGCNAGDEYANLTIWRDRANAFRARNDGRFLHGNFGNGVLGTWWAPNTFAQYVQAVDTSSVDKYAYTSPHVQGLLPKSPYWPSGAPAARSGAYGWLARRMGTFQDPNFRRPAWVFVETAMPYLTEPGARTIALHEIEGAVWAAIINEARGIAYFQHNNNGVCGTYSIVDCGQAVKDKLTAIHAKIRSLAPVINTQSYQHNFNNGTETMLKTHNGNAYVFAGIGLNQSPGTKTFTLPAGINGTTVTVEGESRTIPVVNGRFSDDFAAEYTHHVYRIALAG